MSKSKAINWRKPCLIIGTISTQKGLAALSKPPAGPDVLEVRYDSLRKQGMSPQDLVPYLKKRAKPVLLTLRTTREGGVYNWKSRERVLAFHDLLPYVDAIDMELQNLDLVREVVMAARQQNRGIIFSSHSPTRKLTLGRAMRTAQEFRSCRAEVYKISSLARNRKDLSVLAQVLLKHPHLRLGVMATGPMAEASRVALPLLGSRLAYGYVDVPAAKGQPAVKDLATQLSILR